MRQQSTSIHATRTSQLSSIQGDDLYNSNPLFVMHGIVHHMNMMADKHILPQLQLTYNKFLVMQAIQCISHNSSVTQKQIALYTRLTEATVSRIVTDLQKQGYITRSIDVHHRARHNISLTREGVRAHLKAIALLDSESMKLLSLLHQKEQNELLQYVHRIYMQF